MIVLDTHVLIWWVSDPGKLSVKVRRMVRDASTRDEVVASTISIFEIATLVRRERLRLNVDLDRWLAAVQAIPDFRFAPITIEIARLAAAFDANFPGDPADRLVAATTKVFGARLVTADRRIRAEKVVETVW